MSWRFVVIAMVLCVAVAARAETFTISDRNHVFDAAILDGEFADWNFGGGPLLEVGYMGGIYAEHHAASVISFSFIDSMCGTVQLAKLRLYKPKAFVQTEPVDVGLYLIQSKPWNEGAGFGELPSGGAVTWSTAEKNLQHDQKPIAMQHVGLASGWIEFPLPSDLVQKWLDHFMDGNPGFYLSASSPMKQWGDHVYFASSEDFGGHCPELVIEGISKLGMKREYIQEAKQPLEMSHDSVELKSWLKSDGRLAQFAKDCAMNADQAQVFHFFDTTVRQKLIVDRYQAPLEKIFDQLDQSIQKNDEAAVRTELPEVRNTLLVWEYIRENDWYTSGPVADVLSPKQLAILFGQDIFGAMEQKHQEVEKGKLIRQGKDASHVTRLWEPIADDQLEAHITATLKEYQQRLELSQEQLDQIAPGIREDERLENQYVAAFRHDLDHVRDLLKAGHDDDQMLDAIRQMHRDHELFLYYQSIYDTPRWSLLMAKAPVIPFAKWIVHSRKQSDRETVEAENRDDIKTFKAATQPGEAK